jgi:hypothetical protein
MEAERERGDLRWSARGPQGATRPMASACGRHAASVFCRGRPAVRASGRERKEAALGRAVVARGRAGVAAGARAGELGRFGQRAEREAAAR